MKTGTKHSHRTFAATAVAAALFLTLLLAGCGGPPGAGGDSGPAGTAAPDGGRRVDEDTAFAVNVTRPVRGEIRNYLELNGDVEPASSVDVYPDTNGEVVNMRVRVGQTVSRDEVIAEVDRSRPGQQFEPSPVRAPVAGTVTERYVSMGSTVGPSVPVVQISDTNALEIRTRVAERFISLVREGQEAIIFLEAYPEASFPARVSELSPVVDPATRTMGVTLEFVRRDARVKAGMFVEIRLVTAVKRDVVKVQSDAVVRRFDIPYVFVLTDDDTVEQREVSLGISIGNQVEIADGLEGDEQVIIQGQSLLDDGAEVRVIEEVESLSPEHVISEREGS